MLNKTKIVNLALIVLLLAAFSPANAEQYARIAIDDKSQVIELIQNGFDLLDVEYRQINDSEMFLEWNSSQGFVTINPVDYTSEQLESLVLPVEYFEAETKSLNNELDETLFRIKWGWPRAMNGINGVAHQTVSVANIDGFGGPDVIAHSMAGWQYAWQSNGAWIVGFPFEFEATYSNYSSELSWESSAISDIDEDGYPDIIFGGASGSINWVSYQRAQSEEFEWLNVGENRITGIPAIIDINNDGNKEIIVNSYEFWGDFPHNGLIHVMDVQGNELDGFPVSYPNPSASTPSVGDIDGDNEFEIVIATAQNLDDTGAVYAWNLDGSVVNGWPVNGFYTIGSSPTLADLDGDDSYEVIVRCKEIGGTSGIYAWYGDGNLVENFPIEAPGGHPFGSIAIADMEGDGILELAYGTVQAPDHSAIHVYQANGQIKAGFPHAPGSAWIGGSPIFADVTGDGYPEVIVSLRNPLNYSPSIMCYDAQGENVGYCSTSIEQGDNLPSTPTAWDLDQDGFIEIAALTDNGLVYIWDTDGVPGASSYPCEKGDFARTGQYRHDVPGMSPVENNGQNIVSIPENFSVETIYPSPFNSSVRIAYLLPSAGEVKVSVYDILGRQVELLVSGKMEAGRNMVNWQPTSTVSSGLYFVKISYNHEIAVKKLVYAK